MLIKTNNLCLWRAPDAKERNEVHHPQDDRLVSPVRLERRDKGRDAR
jgi:hypothetical protein